eukprot:850642_1
MGWISCALLYLVFGVSLSVTPYGGDHINIHIVAHTHDDTGYLKTTDEYYVEIIQYIFDTMVPNLLSNPDRRFSYVEMAYFDRWWNEIDEQTKRNTLKILESNQLQINLGGWCMNDEANPTFQAEIRNMMDGAQFVVNNLGSQYNPNVGWHIDPFGSSRVTAAMYSQMGFDAFGLNRIHYQDKDHRKQTKNLEFIWKASNSLGQDSYIFTHILDSGYCSPPNINFVGFDGWDYKNNHWINTNEELPSYPPNYVQMAEAFMTNTRQKSEWYRHNHILIPFGCDFSHMNAFMSFIQMDKLMHYINSNHTYNATIFYSTLYDYTKAVHQLNLTWNVEQNTDFFNYASGPNNWWTGYFVSRPELKIYTRSRERYLKTAELLYTFAMNMKSVAFDKEDAMTNITKMRRAMDVIQHHDGITGTERWYVMQQYMQQLQDAMTDVTHFLNAMVTQFMGKNHNEEILYLEDNVHQIERLNDANILPLLLFNPLAWNVTQLIAVATNRTDIVVYDEDDKLVLSQINPSFWNDTKAYYEQSCQYYLYFIAGDLLPLSFTTYFIRQKQNEKVFMGQIVHDVHTIGNADAFYSLTFDHQTGFLSNITNHKISRTFSISNTFMHYGSTGQVFNDHFGPEDDPYTLRPAQDNRDMLPGSGGIHTLLIQDVVFRKFHMVKENVIPGFIVQMHSRSENQPHFITHICDVNMRKNTFSFQVFTTDKQSFGANQYLTDWIMFGDEYNTDLMNGKLYGSQELIYDGTNRTVIDLKQYNLKSIPMILTSIRKQDCNDNSQYVTTVRSMDTTSATIDVGRVDSNGAWMKGLYLDWIVWDPSSRTNSMTSTVGSFNISLPSNTRKTFTKQITFEANSFIVYEPVVLIQMQQISPQNEVYYWSTKAVGNNAESFTLSMELLNPSSSSNTIQLNVMYWAFERITIKEMVSGNATNIVIKGPLLDEVHQIFRTNYTQSFRVINSMKHDDLQYIDNTIYLQSIDNHTNFVSHFELNDFTNNIIYCCQNSLEYIGRTYDPTCDERVACNFHPSSSQSYIDLSEPNDDIQFSTIVDRAHGVGGDVMNGEYELMLQRRCDGTLASQFYGDRFPEGCLSPSNVTTPNVYLNIDEKETMSYLNRRLFMLQQYKPLQFMTIYNGSIQQWKSQYHTQWTAINDSLPRNVDLLDLRYVYSNNSRLILQLWNMFEMNENKEYSVNETIRLNHVFDVDILNIVNVTEMNLNANIALKDMKRLKWKMMDINGENVVMNKDTKWRNEAIAKEAKSLTVQMSPRHIR